MTLLVQVSLQNIPLHTSLIIQSLPNIPNHYTSLIILSTTNNAQWAAYHPLKEPDYIQCFTTERTRLYPMFHQVLYKHCRHPFHRDLMLTARIITYVLDYLSTARIITYLFIWNGMPTAHVITFLKITCPVQNIPVWLGSHAHCLVFLLLPKPLSFPLLYF